jgi:catechol 2,3-dioxygenase
MSQETSRGMPAARLSHLGLPARDLARMLDFYAKVLGLTISDRGVSPRRGQEMAFLTGDPAVHHQLALVAVGGEGEVGPKVDHLAFEVESLADLRGIRDRAVAEGAQIRFSNHGNAWAIYLTDPEGTAVEVFAAAPFEMQQPFGQPFDLDQSDAEILARTRRLSDAASRREG